MCDQCDECIWVRDMRPSQVLLSRRGFNVQRVGRQIPKTENERFILVNLYREAFGDLNIVWNFTWKIQVD
jgi:hypothetical protein